MIRLDLAEARQAWLQSFQDERQRDEMAQSDFLAYRDADGRVADFHALRHTYISRIVRSGATPKVAQELARDCDVRLTLGRYAHAAVHDRAAAIDALPPLLPTDPSAQPSAPAATGTDGKNSPLPTQDRDISLGPKAAVLVDGQRQAETDDDPAFATENPGNHRENQQFPGSCSDRPLPDSNRGWRICNPLPPGRNLPPGQ